MGTRFEEGIVDSLNEEEYILRLNSLLEVWCKKLGSKGEQFYEWGLSLTKAMI